MTKYHRMTFGEREKIYQLLQSKQNQSARSKSLGRNKSSISRELARCDSDPIGYIPDRAQQNAASFLCKTSRYFVVKSVQLRLFLFFKKGGLEKQISGHLKHENHGMGVLSHETIYQFIYSKEGQAKKLYKLLNRHKPKRTR